MTDRAQPDRTLHARVTVAAVESQLSQLRATVSSALRADGADDEVVDDIELAVSELATNVIQHTSSPTITAAVGAVPGGWALEVANADDIPDLNARPHARPPVDEVTGRGLFIVQSIMDTVELIEVDAVRLIRCTKLVS